MSQHRQTAFALSSTSFMVRFTDRDLKQTKNPSSAITPEMSFRFRYRYTFGEDDCCACIYIYIWNNNNNTREKGRQFDGWLELMHRRLTKLKKKKKTKTIFEYREKALRRHSIFSFFSCCYCFCAFHSSFVKLFPLEKKDRIRVISFPFIIFFCFWKSGATSQMHIISYRWAGPSF